RKGNLRTRLTNLSPCPQCKKLILPHTVCPYCGSYKSHSVVDLAIKSKTRIVKEGR
ncbi:50S ribosomal protein L32, partial [candidate division WWE3 bacterium CG_4_8_14_3_um_filter_42_11]